MIRECETRKLWHDRYLYKITSRASINKIFGTCYGRYKGIEYARRCVKTLEQCIAEGKPLFLPRYRTLYDEYSIDDYEYAREIINCLDSVKSSYRTRNNFGILSIYLEAEEDVDLFLDNKIINSSIQEVHRPNPKSLEHLLSEDKVFLLDHPMPYEYRVYLKPGKNQDLANWLESNKDKSKVTDHGLNSLKTDGWSNIYFYLRDEKLLFLVQMLAGSNIQKIERLVYAGNTDK